MSEGRGKGGAKSEIVVVSALKDWSCVECEAGGSLLTMEDRGPLCLDCADLGHLVYLPSGDAALTRRARKASGLSAVVVRFSRARRRYERQGILVEEPALEQLLMSGRDRGEARMLVRDEVERLLEEWRDPSSG